MTNSVQTTTTLVAGAGGLLWAIANAFAVIFAPSPPDRRSVMRACVEALFSIIAAFIGGWFVGPSICRHLHTTDLDAVSLIGLSVGLAFWPAVPVLSMGIIKVLSTKLAQQKAAELPRSSMPTATPCCSPRSGCRSRL